LKKWYSHLEPPLPQSGVQNSYTLGAKTKRRPKNATGRRNYI
jgi:hypothetical protein